MSIYSIECGGKDHSGILSGILDGVSNIGAAGYSFAAGKTIESWNWDTFFGMTGICGIGSLVFLTLFLWLDWRKAVATREVEWENVGKVMGCCGGTVEEVKEQRGGEKKWDEKTVELEDS